MKRFILSFLTGSLALSSPAFSQYGSQGNYPDYSGKKNIAIIMLAWSDKPCPSSRQTIADRIWNNGNSVRNYFLDMSRGAFEFELPAGSTGGVAPASSPDIYGPYELSIAAGFDKDVTYANADQLYGGKTVPNVKPVAEQVAADKDGFRRSDYNYIMYVTPKSDTTGGIGGYAGYGATYSHMFDVRQNYLNHELGHNFMLAHSNTGIDGDNYKSQDSVMGNGNQCHVDGPQTYQLGWYPDVSFGLRSYGQYEIENLAKQGSDNLKVLRFDRAAHGATNKANYNLWVEYRIKGVDQDAGLNNNWDGRMNVHYCLPRSNRPGDPYITYDHFSNNVGQYLTGGQYTDPDSVCTARFLRKNTVNGSAIVQLIDPNGNQPPSIPAQDITVTTDNTDFTIQTNDPENNPLSYTILTQPAQGTLGVSNGTFSLNGAVIGTYSFTVRVNDGQYDSFDVTIPLQVVGMNPPTADAGADQTVTIEEGTGGGDPVAGAWFEWDASQDTDGNSTWESTTSNSYNWTFDGGALSPVSITDARFDLLTKAYAFPAAKDASNNNWDGYGSNQAASFEFVIDVDGNNGSIFESGATGDGIQVDILNGVLRINVEEDPADVRATYALSAEDMGRFIHVVCVVDNANNVVQLYVDGQLKDNQPWTTGDDWSGTDGAGLGADSGNVVDGGSKDDFNGKMALFRFYKNKALDSTEVTTNFRSLSSGYGAIANLNGVVEDLDGTTPSATWSVVSTTPANLDVIFGNASSPITTALFVEPGTYILRLTADDGVYTGSDEVTITVNPPATSGYDSWASNYDLGGQSGMTDNPDGDKRSNMMEFAFGTDPTIGDFGPLTLDGSRHGDPVSKNDPGAGFWIYFIRRTDHGSSGSVSYTACFSSDLTSFTDSMVGLEVVATSSVNSDYQVVRVPFPDGTKFSCVRVEPAP